MEKTAKPKRQKPDWAKQRDQRRKGAKQKDKVLKSTAFDTAALDRVNVSSIPMKERRAPYSGPPHLDANVFANDPLFRRFKGDSKSKARHKRG